MKIITKEEFLKNEEFYYKEIIKEKIFIYPTDTIYGIGCDGTNSEAVAKIRKIKQRDKKPFSIIVPSQKWILDNCLVKREFENYLDKIPGKYTLILKLQQNAEIARKELNGNTETIGVRIPKNWFGEFIGRRNLVFVTTSVNLAGEKPIKKISHLDNRISDEVDYFIDDGELDGTPSTIIDLSKERVEIIKR